MQPYVKEIGQTMVITKGSNLLMIIGLFHPIVGGAEKVCQTLSKRFMDKPEGDLLKILGFFDRPADIDAIKKIIEQPVIENLTENLCNKGEASLLQAIVALRNKELLDKEKEP